MSYTDLHGKIAIITGASRGIGFAVANIFKDCGALVIGISNNCQVGEKNGVYYFNVDVSNTLECDILVRDLINKYKKIDILVNCAGIVDDALTQNMTEEQFDSVIAVNLKGVWNMTKLIGPHMQKNKSGSIINISSVVGFYGNIGQCNYAASKSGVIGMTKSWAKEFSRNNSYVRVNAIAPGYCKTDMLKDIPQKLIDMFKEQTMLKRLGEPDDVAKVALFLASDLSSYVTGTTIHVDGGMRL